jgi:hypothetical protein
MAGQRLGLARLGRREPGPVHQIAHHGRFIGKQQFGDAAPRGDIGARVVHLVSQGHRCPPGPMLAYNSLLACPCRLMVAMLNPSCSLMANS